jgi:pilus assembly protein CpaE
MVALARCAGNEVRAFASYPPSLGDMPRLLEEHHDVIIIDLDSDPEFALELVESIGANGTATVMVYSAKADPDLLVRCMRSGAREFLTLPLELDVVAESLGRAAARKPVVRITTVRQKKVNGKLLAFMGSKGGAGVTTVATNFAVALAQHPSQKTLLIDLDLPLGDAALNLGIISEYSTIDALQALDRLDGSFLSGLLMEHSSGLKVLAAPGRYVQYQVTDAAIDRLLTVARQEFDNVVIDLGSKVDLTGTVLFKEANAIYLVTQMGIPELRNSNRLISQVFSSGGPKLEIVINRYETSALGVSEEHITKALTRPAKWKIPNDYASVKRMQVNATPLVLTDSAVSRKILQMAGEVTGELAAKPKKKVFNLFG